MLPSFVIGLREGLEAALIVGIIAAFLRKQGRRDLLRWVLIGVAIAVLLCLGAGVALDAFSRNLPQRQQEGLETVIAVLAVGMVTYMVVWMKRHSRDLKGQLEGLAADAMSAAAAKGDAAKNAGRAMVLMAFLAVIREGLETVVFLLAAFNETDNGATAGLGALLGILIAVALGYGIYRGGVRLNLSKFFRVTGFVLVLVAAGLVVNAFHTAHEAGWIDFGQTQTVDLSWLVQPGTVWASLLTGMLGLQPRPVVVEVVAWLVYLVPVGLYVVWPQGRPAPTRAGIRGGLAVGVVAGIAAIVTFVVAPGTPDQSPVTRSGSIVAQVLAQTDRAATIRTTEQGLLSGRGGTTITVRMAAAGTTTRDGLPTERFTATRPALGGASQRLTSLPLDQIALLNGGRIPVGIRQVNAQVPVTYRDSATVTVWLDERTGRVVDLTWRERTVVVAGTSLNSAQLTKPAADVTRALPAAAVSDAVAAARHDRAELDRRSALTAAAGWCLDVAVVALLVALAFALVRRRTRPVPERTPSRPDLVRH